MNDPLLPTGDDFRVTILNAIEETYRLLKDAAAIIHREDAGSPTIYAALLAVVRAVVDLKLKAFEQTYDFDRLRSVALRAVAQRDEALRQRDALLEQLTAAREDTTPGARRRRRSASAPLEFANVAARLSSEEYIALRHALLKLDGLDEIPRGGQR